jgi:NitT/TauT family transport system substrate-binding protein
MKKLLLVAVALTLVVSGPAFAGSNRVYVAIGTDSLIYLAAYVAKERGYFAEEGLQGDIKVFRGGIQALAAVISGDADVYLGPPSTAMKAINAGQNVIVFGNVMDQIPTNIVIQGDIAKKKGINSASSMADRIQALKGLTIGVNAVGGAPDQVLQYTLRAQGIDPQKEVVIAPVGGPSALVGSFEQKRIDGLAFSSPASDLAVEKFNGVMVVNYAVGEYEPLRGFLYLGLIARHDWLDEDSNRAAHTVRAFAKALTLIKTKPDEAREALRKFFPDMDEDALKKGFAANAAALPSEPSVSPHSVELNADFLEKIEGIKYGKPLDTVFTNRFVDLSKRLK